MNSIGAGRLKLSDLWECHVNYLTGNWIPLVMIAGEADEERNCP